MKLKDILTEIDGSGFNAGVPASGPDASRGTPTASLQNYGGVNAPLPHEFGKDRTWWEEKEKKKKKRKKVKELEQRYDNRKARPY